MAHPTHSENSTGWNTPPIPEAPIPTPAVSGAAAGTHSFIAEGDQPHEQVARCLSEPWVVEGDANSHVFDERIMAGEICVAFCDAEHADLIAASPNLMRALAQLLPGKLCGESWGLPDEETVAITVTFGKLRAARAALAEALGKGA